MAPRLSMSAEEKKWQIEDDLRTLTRAEEIKRDPKRLAAAKKMAKERLEEVQSVIGDGKKK